jgi:hypothetical protein
MFLVCIVPVILFTLLFLLFKNNRQKKNIEKESIKKYRTRRIIKKVLIIFFMVISILFILSVDLSGTKYFRNISLSKGQLILYESNENVCRDWCTPYYRIRTPFETIYIENFNLSNLNRELNRELNADYYSCNLSLDNKTSNRRKFVYRNGKYWYKLKLKDESSSCRLNGYVYVNVLDSYDFDFSDIK